MDMKNIAVLLIIAWMVSISCSDQDQRPPVESSREFPESELYNSTIILSKEGIRNTVIKARYIAKYKEKKEAFARDIEADLYDTTGQHTSYLTADSGWINEEAQEMEMMGHVVVINEEGVRLETESLRWDPDINKIVTDDFVRITRGEDILTGYGLRTDQNMENIEILRNVKGRIKEVPEEDLE